MMRVLVTGANGQLGTEIMRAFASDDAISYDVAALDVTDRDSVHAAHVEAAPDLVVHCAAWTDVDGCENDPARAFAVNALGTRNVAEAARRATAHLVHVSTDYVFDGTLDRPYNEWDEPHPLGVYGRSKYAAELEVGPDATVVRTAWLFGRTGRNIVKTILALSERQQPLRFVTDQVGTPTEARDLACSIRHLAVARAPGLYHVTNGGEASWFEFARAVLECAARDAEIVEPIVTADLDPPRPAPRPANSRLANVALANCGLAPLRDYREPLREVVASILD